MGLLRLRWCWIRAVQRWWLQRARESRRAGQRVMPSWTRESRGHVANWCLDSLRVCNWRRGRTRSGLPTPVQWLQRGDMLHQEAVREE
ncbi:hypothetical protein BU16DRAFT_256839 [Lophium mytilinum]|uniref:Uncharacterized protein n=1 Tax=Lophium mytilinum TaxID=390894 RepID=A0A6A6R8D8_9PEZI|nr:hypothetical protein BU16DRAFT_256839 [Lophium mytilinum]